MAAVCLMNEKHNFVKIKTDLRKTQVGLVREAGVEPARPCEHWHLKPASLPIPPLAQRDWEHSHSVRYICYHM